MFLSYLWGARDWGGCEQGVCVALTFCMGACDAWHVTCDVVMTCDWPSPCPLSSPASVSDQMTTNCHQSQQNSGKISTRIIFVRRTGVIQTSHTRGETLSVITSIIRCHVLSPHCWWAQCTPPQCQSYQIQANVRRAFVIATRAKYPRNENTSQPLSLYDWPIRELGAAKRNHISDVIRISSELIRTWRQQLMQHLIMTWYPDPDSGVTRVSTHQYWRPRHIWSHWSAGRRPGRGWTGGGSPAWVPRAPPPSSDLGDLSLANLKWKGKLMMGFVCLGVRVR